MAVVPVRTPRHWSASRRVRRRTVPPVFGRRCSLRIGFGVDGLYRIVSAITHREQVGWVGMS